MAIFKLKTLVGCIMLLAVVISQSIGYGLVLDPTFFLRNLSICGGLLILLAGSTRLPLIMVRFICACVDSLEAGKSRTIFAGLPEISETDKTQYLTLAVHSCLLFLNNHPGASTSRAAVFHIHQ